MIQLNVSSVISTPHSTIRVVPGESLTLGRERSCDYAFEGDSQMSSQHLRISARDQFVEFEDLSSTNGTFLNGKRVFSGTARSGDELRAGQTVFTVLSITDEKPPVPPSGNAFVNRSEAAFALEIETVGFERRRLSPDVSLTVGRTALANWTFDSDSQMSSLHFGLQCRDEVWEVIDYQSSNGTFLGQQRVRDRHPIADGDELLAGRTRFRLRLVNLKPDDRRESSRITPGTATSADLPSSKGQKHDTTRSQSLTKEIITPKLYDESLENQSVILLLPHNRELGPIAVGRKQAIGVFKPFTVSPALDSPAELLPGFLISWCNEKPEMVELQTAADCQLNGLPTARSVLQPGDVLLAFGESYTVRCGGRVPDANQEMVGATVDFTNVPTEVNNDPTRETVDFASQTPKMALEDFGKEFAENDEIVEANQFRLPASTRLPSELGKLLLQVTTDRQSWLMEITDDRTFISLPSRIALDDEVWTYNIQASWPRKAFLVALSDSPAEELFDHLASMPESGGSSRFSSANLETAFGSSPTGTAPHPAIGALMLIEPEVPSIRLFGKFHELTNSLKAASKQLGD